MRIPSRVILPGGGPLVEAITRRDEQIVAELKNFAAHPALPVYTVTTLPAATAGHLIYVSNESGGAVVAFADGTNWRRVTDRAIVS